MPGKRPVRNDSFEDPEHIGSTFALQPQQLAATAQPRRATKALVRKRTTSPNALARQVNDFLADPTVR